MALSERLLKTLVCPVSHGPLELVKKSEDVYRLFSPEVGVYFPIQEPDIPVILAQSAEREDGSSAESPLAEWRASRRIS